MHPRVCMVEHFDLIINSFKYKCETCKQNYTFISKIYMMNVKCNSKMDLTN